MLDEDDPLAKQGQCFRCGMFSLIIGSIPLVGYRLPAMGLVLSTDGRLLRVL